jgi:hypothetical protein
VTVSGLPSLDNLDAGTIIDMNRLLEFRQDPVSKEFRRWLRNIDDASDEEIAYQVNGVTEKFRRAVHSLPGKAMRLAISHGVGVVGGGVSGVAASAADTFLTDKLIRKPGPIASISRRYKSMFETT